MIHVRRALAIACLAAGLGWLVPQAQGEEALTDAQKQAIDSQIRDYLMAHPEVIIESLQQHEQKQEEEQAAQQKQQISERRDELLHSAGTPVAGNPDASFAVVEFFDYHCPYCKSVAGDFIDTMQKDGNVRVVFKEFPILGESSVFAAKVALAAAKQGKYVEMHRALMALKGDLSEDAVYGLAAKEGLDVEKLKQDAGSTDVEEELNRNYELARALGIRGTPAFIVGEELIPGALPMEELMAKIDEQRKS
jgi:protein-disulfide isomerase